MKEVCFFCVYFFANESGCSVTIIFSSHINCTEKQNKITGIGEVSQLKSKSNACNRGESMQGKRAKMCNRGEARENVQQLTGIKRGKM